MVRAHIDDLAAATYNDDTLEEVIVHAAAFVINDVDFSTTYTIDIVQISISPDPTATSPNDWDFMNLIALKAACIILRGEAKQAAASVLSIVDGPSSVDTKGQYEAKKKMYEDMCREYSLYKQRMQAGGSQSGHVILGPYTAPIGSLYGFS